MNQIDAIYTRQSVDRVDSISVESQVEFCKREVIEGEHKIYSDKGYSGKNIDRPAFQQLMQDIQQGKIRRVIVYRLDRISRSVLDFASVIDTFQKYNVDFISTVEKFDTSTPIGKAMLMIVMIFAQLERETIQQRVYDAYHSRSKRGFYMGGKIPYGFQLQETFIDGIRTKMYVPVPEEAEIVRLVFSMYADPQTSLGDVARYLKEQDVTKRDGENFSRSSIRDIVTSTLYVRADFRLYEFFKAHGAEVINPPEDFIGEYGAYFYSGEGKKKRKTISIEGHTFVLAPHQGLVDSSTWIRCRSKCLKNAAVAKASKAKATWLAGKIKCPICGYALTAKVSHCKTKTDNRYYLCSRKYSSGDCTFSSLDADEIDAIMLEEMTKKLEEFKTLKKQSQEGDNLQTIQRKTRIAEIDGEIDALLANMSQSNDILMRYINQKIVELDAEKKDLHKEILQLTDTDKQSVDDISDYLEKWDEISMSDKITVVDSLVKRIIPSQEKVQIYWKI